VRSRIEKGKKIKAKTRQDVTRNKKQVSSPNVQHPNKGSTITAWEIQPEWGKAKQNNSYGAREECKSANSSLSLARRAIALSL
jgi:exosome complex RNA-binding protein Rrp42 (RNase PH superfamily)